VTGSRVLANTGYRLLADVGGKVGSVVLFIVMGRKLGDASFGVFTFAYSLVAIVTALADFGQDKVLTREVARERGLLDRYFLNTLVLKLGLALPALAVAVAALAAGGRSNETVATVALLGAAVLVDLLASTAYATFQAYERLEFIPVALITERFVTAAAGIVALLLGAGVVTIAAIFLGGALLTFVLAMRLLVRHVVRPVFRIERSRWWPLMLAAAPIGLAGIASVFLFRIDTVLLAAFKSDEVVGNYGAAYRLFESTLFLSWAVGAAAYPVYSQRTGHGLAGVYERTLKLAVALTLPFAVGAAVLGDRVIEILYGDDFDTAGTALRLLSPAIVFYALAYLAGYVLVSQQRPLVLTAVYAAVAVENVLLNLVLIPTYSLNGAAIGTSISEGLVAIALVWGAWHCGGVADFGRVLAGPVLAGAAAAAVMWALHDQFALAVVGGALAYGLTLALFEGTVFPHDANALWSSLRPARALRRS
jgi:O-antigen/teichoic acid export membrane protein